MPVPSGALILCLLATARAGSPDEAAPLEVNGGDGSDVGSVQPAPDAPAPMLRFFGLVQARTSTSNVVSTSLTADGQVVGLLGGLNQTSVSAEDTSQNSEFRTGGFFTLTPPLLGGQASLTAAFEVDYGFGDQAYQVGGNTGGGYGGDQVNLQTRRLHATWSPQLGGGQSLSVVAGLQFISDGVYDPSRAALDDLARAGGGMRFFGSEAAGLTAYGRWRTDWGDRLRWKLGGYTLYEKGNSLPDDVTLWMADVQVHPAYALRVGAHAWYLKDRTGGVVGLAGAGPTSILSELQGAPALDLRYQGQEELPEVNADLWWAGLDTGYNHRLDRGPLGFSASAFWNFGGLLVKEGKDAAVRGLAIDAEGRWRYAAGSGSVLRLEGLYTSADGPGRDAYTGVLTGNSYGVVGAIWTTHGSYLLFPDGRAINRQAALVYDISNQGDGLLAIAGGVGRDVVPDRFNLQVGAAHARDAAGAPEGTEINARISGKPLPFFEVGGVGAVVAGSEWEVAPWVSFLYLDWIVF